MTEDDPIISEVWKDVQQLWGALRIAEEAAKTQFDALKRDGLVQRINGTVLAYHGTRFMAEVAREFTLHNIEAPLAEVIEKLEHEANIDAVLIALGAPAMLMLSPNQEPVHRAIAEYEATLNSLRKIAANLPATPAKRGKGQPRARDLYDLVYRLADIWKAFTGKDFTQYWHQGKPVSKAARFVYAVVEVVDRSRLEELPTVTKNVVADLRKATPRK
jgi:hypothetical protein